MLSGGWSPRVLGESQPITEPRFIRPRTEEVAPGAPCTSAVSASKLTLCHQASSRYRRSGKGR